MTDEELQMRRERHDREMRKLDAEIALALREARFPASVMASVAGAIALAVVAPWLLSLLAVPAGSG